ncbi:MAG: AEC family transporter [Eggerthellales bacterium]|nr:AEC family transporter [Eggerthellales bacterium]
MAADPMTIVVKMIMLFVLIGVGYICKKVHYTNEVVDKGLSNLVINIAMPALILSAILTADSVPSVQEIGLTFLLALLMHAFLIGLAVVVVKVLRIPNGFCGAFRFMLVFGNVGFLGFPVLAVIFGPGALLYASIFQVPFNLICYVVGPILISKDREGAVPEKVTIKTFLTPMTICCLIAIVLAVAGVRNVPFVTESLTLLGNMATPAAMLIIGSQMANMPVRDMLGTPKLWLMSAVRLVVNPILVWLLFSPIIQSPLLLGVLVIMSAMPVANVGVMFSLLYGIDTKTMSQGIFVSTMLSALTIPLLVFIMG